MNTALIQQEKIACPKDNKQYHLSRLSKELLTLCEKNNISFSKAIAIRGSVGKGQLYTLASLTNMIIIMTGVNTKKSSNNLLKCSYFYDMHLRFIFQYITGLYEHLPFAEIQAIENPKRWKNMLDTNVLTNAIGFKALAYVGKSFIDIALNKGNDLLELTRLSKINELPLTKRDNQLWLDAQIYQLTQGEINTVKSSEKPLARLFCSEIGILPCSELLIEKRRTSLTATFSNSVVV